MTHWCGAHNRVGKAMIEMPQKAYVTKENVTYVKKNCDYIGKPKITTRYTKIKNKEKQLPKAHT